MNDFQTPDDSRESFHPQHKEELKDRAMHYAVHDELPEDSLSKKQRRIFIHKLKKLKHSVKKQRRKLDKYLRGYNIR